MSQDGISTCESTATLRHRLQTGNVFLLCAAWAAALVVFSPALEGGWLSDDYDYVLNDPRLNNLQLFVPGHWSDSPPVLKETPDGTPFLPEYQRPLISDRFIWRLSFAVERYCVGLSPAYAHMVNLLLHLACIAALYWSLSRLLNLYGAANSFGAGNLDWQLLPGIASLIFAIHPWVSEPVCYVSARNASLGTLFVLLGLGCWAGALHPAGNRSFKILQYCGAGLCALAAFASKENFITAFAGYFLATCPLLWRRCATLRWQRVLPIALGIALLLFALAFAGIHVSERAAGLWAQARERGLKYCFEIQSPLLLKTLLDQVPTLRLSFEANHPNWPLWSCVLALGLNAILIAGSLLIGLRWPILLGVTWFYLHLFPTNSFLPRPDFLAARNVYLPMAGIATLLAGAMLSARRWLLRASPLEYAARLMSGRARIVTLCAALLLVYWGVQSRNWSGAFAAPENLWARSAKIAPDHVTVRLNLACAMLNETMSDESRMRQCADAERELRLALGAENSSTMQFYTERPRRLNHALALRLLAQTYVGRGDVLNAVRLYRESFTLQPTLAAWIGWAMISLNGSFAQDSLNASLEGQRRWPDAWWPRAVRGLCGAAKIPDQRNLPPEIVKDLEAAEQTTDETQPELRSLQRYALYQLAQAAAVRSRAPQLMERLRALGLSADEQVQLAAMLQPDSSTEREQQTHGLSQQNEPVSCCGKKK